MSFNINIFVYLFHAKRFGFFLYFLWMLTPYSSAVTLWRVSSSILSPQSLLACRLYLAPVRLHWSLTLWNLDSLPGRIFLIRILSQLMALKDHLVTSTLEWRLPRAAFQRSKQTVGLAHLLAPCSIKVANKILPTGGMI